MATASGTDDRRLRGLGPKDLAAAIPEGDPDRRCDTWDEIPP